MWATFKILTKLVTMWLLGMFWGLGSEASGILVPGPRIEPVLPALESEAQTPGFPGKSPHQFF